MIETDDKENVIGYKNINMFPDDVETITMTRQDYDRHMENLIYENVELKQRIDKAIESLNYYIEGMNKSLEIWNKVKENEKIDDDTLLQMLEREKQNYINVLDILKGSDTNDL